MSELVNVSILFNSDLLIDVGKAMETMRRKQSEGVEKSLVTLGDMIKIRTPYASGELRASLGYEMREITRIGPYGFATGTIGFVGKVRSMEAGITGRALFFSPWTYVEFVEHGTIPHWPPYEPIHRWVRQVLQPVTMIDDLWTTFKVARHIKEKGTPGQHMFKRGREEFEAKHVLEDNMKESAEEGMAIITAEKPWWAAF